MIQQLRFTRKWLLCAAAGMLMLSGPSVDAATVRLTVQNIGPIHQITPLFAGFHGASDFSVFTGGAPASAGLESLAEDGATGTLTAEFNAATAGNGVSSTIVSPGGPPPFAPGETTFQDFTIATDGSNSFLSVAAMVLPSNDFFVARQGLDISSVLAGGGPITLILGVANGGPGSGVYDAGTEAEDFAVSAANGLFAGLPPGQGAPNTGAADPVNAVRLVTGADPFAAFANIPVGFDTTAFDFNDATLNTAGLFSVTVTAVPEPSMGFAACMILGGVVARRRRR